jgi:tRNA(fMet)-specific endonuclease VapC
LEVKRLLDTSAYVGFKRGHNEVVSIVRASDELVFSMVVAGELLFGFRNGTRWQKNLSDLEGFLADPLVTLLPVTWTTADRFGRIAADLRRAAKPIPSNDIWIAAHAFESGAELVTFDKHFESVPGLAVQMVG